MRVGGVIFGPHVGPVLAFPVKGRSSELQTYHHIEKIAMVQM